MINIQPYLNKLDVLKEYMDKKIDGELKVKIKVTYNFPPMWLSLIGPLTNYTFRSEQKTFEEYYSQHIENKKQVTNKSI